jgi:hypothetical protein
MKASSLAASLPYRVATPAWLDFCRRKLTRAIMSTVDELRNHRSIEPVYRPSRQTD